jgi:hypothetical protein
LQVIHQRGQIIREGAQANLFLRTDGPGLAVSAGIETNQANPLGWTEDAERLRQVGSETVLKKEW